MSAHAESHEEKVKKYFNVFYGLIVLTVIELIIVKLPLPHWLGSLGVALFSSAKAVVVGYYYMHLEHETKWLKMIACLPVIAFGYAFFLSVDAHTRTPHFYQPEPPRTFLYENESEEGEGAEHVGTEGQGDKGPIGIKDAHEEEHPLEVTAGKEVQALGEAAAAAAAAPKPEAKAEKSAAGPAAGAAPAAPAASAAPSGNDSVENFR